MARIQGVIFVLAVVSSFCSWSGIAPSNTEASLLQTIVSWINPEQRLWDDLLSRIVHFQRLGRKSICYEALGCFHVRGLLSHVRRLPDDPRILQTELWICTRRSPEPVDSATQLVTYDKRSLEGSVFDPGLPIKVIVHGYRGRFKSPYIMAAKDAILKAEDVAVVLVNWQLASSGSYLRSASNAELVGRQAGRTLISMASMGTRPSDIHVIGFSLGAQVAGFIGETFKSNNMKLGRITGLDPASFLFESWTLPAYRRLDHTDADYVEVIHTDGSRVWSDGFGLLAPVGHVDFFPNGGVDQPGCRDSYIGALAFRINQNANSSEVCSHGRAWNIFLETLTSEQCQFLGFPCPGLRDFRQDFLHGNCFRSCDDGVSTCGVMGQMGTARGALYLVTRPTGPYCGQQLKASVWISPRTLLTRGVLQMRVYHRATTTDFALTLPSRVAIEGGREVSAVVAALPGAVSARNTPSVRATITFTPSGGMTRIGGPQHLFLDRISLMDHHGNSWQHCGKNLLLEDKIGTSSDNITVQLHQTPCSL